MRDGGGPARDARQFPVSRNPGPESAPQRPRRPYVAHEFSRVRPHMREQCRGIFKPPPPNVRVPSPARVSSIVPDLPPRHVADQLLRHYHASIHTTLPLIHWPSFTKQYESVYRQGNLRDSPRIWSALLFVVFACGALNRQPPEGDDYLKSCKSLVDPWDDDLTLDHVRTAMLICIFLMEMNLKSASWIWLGSAIRTAQDVGLYFECGSWPQPEQEMRRRVWWCVYALDR